MRVYFLDQFFLSEKEHAQVERIITGAGHELIFRDWTQKEQVIEGAKDADAIIHMAVPMTAEVMDAIPNLKIISRCGIGYDNVDIQAAAERGIIVCNVPDHCVYEVASHIFALIMALERQLFAFAARGKTGAYANGKEIKCHRIKGQTLGLLGYGRIGRELAKMCVGVGMNVLVSDPFVKEIHEPGIVLASSKEEVIQNADVICPHTPLTPSTFHLIGREDFAMMKPTAYLVNASRGGVVDTEALIDALKTGKIAGAGVDVIEGEPIPAGNPIHEITNLLYTPHVGMYSEEAMEDMYNKLTAQLLDALDQRWPNNVVNPAVREKLCWAK